MSRRIVRSILLATSTLAFVTAAYVLMARGGLFQLDRDELISEYADSTRSSSS